MLKTIIVLPDGTQLSSGNTAGSAVESVTLTQNINEEQELTVGTVCSAMMELTVLTQEGSLAIDAGTELTVYREDAAGNRQKTGLFLVEKPTRKSANRFCLTAYDRVSLLDRDMTDWLAGLSQWPYPLAEFGEMVCAACGLELSVSHCLNGDFPVEQFAASNVTGRQLMRWVCQAAGAFCRAGADGKLQMDWYRDRGRHLTPEGTDFYYQNSLSYEDYAVEPVRQVQLQQSREDVGVCYPDISDSDNTFVITGNPLLAAEDSALLYQAAQSLYEQLRTVTYTPCKISVPVGHGMDVGEIFTVTDRGGKTFTALSMQQKQSGQKDTLECTGSVRRSTSSAKGSLSYHTLTGRVLNLTADVDGLKAENKDAAGKSAGLQLNVEGIRAEVARQNQSIDGISRELTSVRQAADQVKLTVESIQENGTAKVTTATGYTFSEDGLRIQKSGQEMENKLTDTGMYVSRGSTTMLQADKDGVVATDVSVRNYLVIGSHARFEDYSDGADTKRTACYWI